MSTKFAHFAFIILPENRQSYSYASATCARLAVFPFKPEPGKGGMMKNEVERALEAYQELGVTADVGYIYILKATNGLYKIGKTQNLNNRIKTIRTASPVKIEVYRVFQSTEYSKIELHLHSLFSDFREIGEWFRLTDEELATIDEIQGDHTLLPCYL